MGRPIQYRAAPFSMRLQGVTTFFRIFMQYRLAFAVLNLVPYVALKIMA